MGGDQLSGLEYFFRLSDGQSFRRHPLLLAHIEREGYRSGRDYPASTRSCIFIPTESGHLFRRGLKKWPPSRRNGWPGWPQYAAATESWSSALSWWLS